MINLNPNNILEVIQEIDQFTKDLNNTMGSISKFQFPKDLLNMGEYIAQTNKIVADWEKIKKKFQ